MESKLKKEIENYIEKNRDSFERYILQTDIFDDNGKINLESLSEIAKNEITNMHNLLDDLEYEEISKQIRKAYQGRQFSEILRLQFMLNISTKFTLPISIARLAVNESLFAEYCKILYINLW